VCHAADQVLVAAVAAAAAAAAAAVIMICVTNAAVSPLRGRLARRLAVKRH